MLRDNRTGIEKKRRYREGLTLDIIRYATRGKSIIIERKEQSLFGIVVRKKKKIIPTNGRIFLNNDIPFYAQEKFAINNTNRIIIKIIN